MHSRSIHTVTSGDIFYGRVIVHCIYSPHFFVHSSMYKHSGYFHMLAIVNKCCNEHGNADVSELLISFPLDCSSELGLLNHMIVLLLIFRQTSILFSIVAAPIFIHTSSAQWFFFYTPIPTPCFSSF